MIKSEHELVVAQQRDKARLKLIDMYIEVAIDNSKAEEYGFLNVMGHEVPDPTVMEPPLGYVAQPDLMEQMRRMIHTSLARIAEDQQFETPEEGDDFDIDDDPVDYTSPWEEYFNPPEHAPAGPAAEPPPETPPPPADERGGGGAEPPSA